MATPELIQAIMGRVVETLKGRGLGFGDPTVRPYSFYAHLRREYGDEDGHAFFARYAWDKAVLCGAIPGQVDVVEDDFPDAETAAERILAERAVLPRDKLEAVTNYCDLYGLWVKALKVGQVPPALMDAIRAWAMGHIPADCLGQIGLGRAVETFASKLVKLAPRYGFDQDFFESWLAPGLADAKAELLRGYRPRVGPRIGPLLTKRAERILGVLSRSFGIYGLRADELARRSLLLVIQADLPTYDAHRDNTARWAVQVLKEQIKLAMFFHCQPRMEMRDRWGPKDATESAELTKREVWLKKFISLVGRPRGPAPSQEEPQTENGSGADSTALLERPRDSGDVLDGLLNEIEGRVLRALVQEGYRSTLVALVVQRIKDMLRQQFANSPSLELKKEKMVVADVFFTLVMGHGFHLPVRLVINVLHMRGRLSDDEAVCLWLGLFHERSPRCEGLWQMYEVYRNEGGRKRAALVLPPAIDAAFSNPQGRSGEAGRYAATQLRLANGALRSVGREPLEECDIPQLIAWVLATQRKGQSALAAAENLDTSGVDNNIRRGLNTLLFQLLRDIYNAIDQA